MKCKHGNIANRMDFRQKKLNKLYTELNLFTKIELNAQVVTSEWHTKNNFTHNYVSSIHNIYIS